MLQSFATRWYTVLQFGKKKYRNPDEGLYSLQTHCTYQRSSISLALQNWTHTLKQRFLTIRKAIGLHFECTHKDLVGLWLTLRASYLWNIIPSKIFPIRPEQIQSPPFFPWLEAPGEKFWLIRTLAWKVAVKIWTTGHWPTNSLGKMNAQIGPLEKSIPWIWLLNDLSSSYQVLILFNTHVEINVKIYECPMNVLRSNKNRNYHIPIFSGLETLLRLHFFTEIYWFHVIALF